MTTEVYPVGRRLIPSYFDHIAQVDPHRVWGIQPRNNSDLSQGFENITFEDLSVAVDRAAWWLQDTLGPTTVPFEVFAYQGPHDLRIPILALAAAKTQRQILLPSSITTRQAQEHLLKATHCTTFLHAATLTPRADCSSLGLKDLVVPEVATWMSKGAKRPFAYSVSFDKAKLDPWIIFHTSGTTGLPKPIHYSHLMMVSFDSADLIDEEGVQKANNRLRGGRWYSAIPLFHYVGMLVALQSPLFRDVVYVVAPPGPPDVTVVSRIIEHARVTGAILMPLIIEGLTQSEHGFRQLLSLENLYFAGAPLRKALGDQLAERINLVPAIGSTEAGAYLRLDRGDKEWEWMTFPSESGMQFEHFSDDLFEMVFYRQPEYERWQQVFQVYPDLHVFRTKDLFTKHPYKDDLWKFAGRTDDLVKLSSGYGVYAAKIEEDLMKSESIEMALVGGEGMPKPFAIISPSQSGRRQHSEQELIEYLLEVFTSINQQVSEIARFPKELILLADAARPFARTAKGTVARKETFALYRDDIEAMYERYRAER